jgi:WD40 repeat protein
MDFSETYRCSGKPVFSPDGRLLAHSVEYRLIVRETESLRVVQLFSCLDRVDTVEWSSNSTYVLCGLHSRGIVQIWAVDQPEWTCKIDEGPAGVQAVRWAPDGARAAWAAWALAWAAW